MDLAFLLTLGFTVWIVIAIAVGADATRRENSAIFWFVVSLLMGILGVLIYVLIRSPRTDVKSIDEAAE